MYEQSGNIILLIIGMIMLMIIVLIQCATGKRVKRINLSNNKSKTTQVSESSSRSVKKARRLQKEQMKREVENSKRSLPKKEESVKESSISKRSQTDNEFTRSNKSKSYRKMKNINNQSNETQQKTTSADTSAEIFEKSLTVIPTVNTGMSKNMEMAKPADTQSKFDEEMRGNIFKEQEQNTQENIGLIDEKKEQELIIEPKNLRWTGEGGYQTVQLQNITNDRLAIKAKCSDNQLYRVNPVFGFINPGEKLKVDIMRQKAMPKVDKMIFVSVRANKDDIFPRPLFKRSKDSQKVAMLPLLIARVI
ncbi:Uncharacterized protein ACO02O_11804 [Dirofilaria immitis]